MGASFLNLNEPPEQEENAQYVMLLKDNKTISGTKCANLPIKVPSLWIISDYKPREFYWQLNLPRYQLYPEHNNSQQKREWVAFLNYLSTKKMVAIVKFERYTFYILVPDDCLESRLATVCYRKQKGCLIPDDQKYATSEDFVHKSCKIGYLKPTDVSSNYVLNPEEKVINNEDSRHLSGGKFVDSVCLDAQTSNTCYTKLNSPQNKHHSNDVKVHQSPMDPSPCESVEDNPSRSQLISPTRSDHIIRNFVQTNPSYLQTLSHTHSGWIFGAIAELVDNSRDANAKRLDIKIECLYSKKAGCNIPVLSIVDDGHGMSHVDIVRMLSFGHNLDGEDPNRIGKFGIGFKTGAMRLGKDAMVLTQTSSSRSVALLSQTYNANNKNLEIPIITYCKQGNYMEVDPSIQSEECASFYLKAIKEVSPFNEYLIGQKLGSFGENGTGTQIYIWNLDKWGADYSLEWSSEQNAENAPHDSRSDIFVRSRRVRSRPGQISQQVPLDYSLHAFLEVIFLTPRIKIYVQGSLVKSRPLARYLTKTVVVKGQVMGKAINLTLGRRQLEWERVNCGMFLYWHGRLIEAYKRVGGMIHNADMGRGVIGVIDVTNIMDGGDHHTGVLNSKQGFLDCAVYAKLEDWLGNKADEYWDEHFDKLDMVPIEGGDKPDREWVQCNKCRKWRTLTHGFRTENLPPEWFCYMSPFNGKCETPEEQIGSGVFTTGHKRTGYESEENIPREEKRPKHDADMSVTIKNTSIGVSGKKPSKGVDCVLRPALKRIRRGPSRSCKLK